MANPSILEMKLDALERYLAQGKELTQGFFDYLVIIVRKPLPISFGTEKLNTDGVEHDARGMFARDANLAA
jgi:hypothetical protein